MPYKSAHLKIEGTSLDRRRKLTEADKAEILLLKDRYSQRGLAKLFGVSRRTIQFILMPEKMAQNLLRRKERGGSKQYYDREKQNQIIKAHRRYKQQLFLDGKIKPAPSD